jgi:hypothetical protein
LSERAIMLPTRAELLAVGCDFALDTRRAHALLKPSVGRKGVPLA